MEGVGGVECVCGGEFYKGAYPESTAIYDPNKGLGGNRVSVVGLCLNVCVCAECKMEYNTEL